MKLLKPIILAIMRFIFLIILPIILIDYLTSIFPQIGIDEARYTTFVLLMGILYIAFKFMEESSENPKFQMVFGMVALTFIILWTYYIANEGVIRISIENILVELDYMAFLWIILLLMALRYPLIFLKYYSELQRSAQKKTPQSSPPKPR